MSRKFRLICILMVIVGLAVAAAIVLTGGRLPGRCELCPPQPQMLA